MRILATVAIALSSALVAGCSGAGSSHAAVPLVNAPVTSSAGGGKITLTIKHLAAPATATQSSARSTQTIAFITHALKLEALDATGASIYQNTYDVSPTSVNCQIPVGIYYACSVGFTPPIATSAAIRVSACPDAACASKPLSSGTVALTSANFKAGQANTISVTLTGIAAKLAVFAGDASPNAAESIPLTVELYDASGSVILGPDAYAGNVTVTTSDAAQSLSLVAVPNLDQQTTNATPGPASSPAASVTFDARFVQPVLNFGGTSSTSPFTVTASFSPAGGAPLTAQTTITPTAAGHTLITGSGNAAYAVTGSVVVNSVRQDSAGNYWALTDTTRSNNSAFTALSSSFAAGMSYPVSANVGGSGSVRNVYHTVTGPDGNMWFTYCVNASGTCTSTGFAKFDISAHTFSAYPTVSKTRLGQVFNTGTSLVAVTSGSSAIEVLSFSGSTPGSVSEVPFAPPAGVSTMIPANVPAPAYIAQVGSTTYVIENDQTGVTPTYIAQIDAAGNKVAGSETIVNANAPALQLLPIATSSSAITFADLAYDGQIFVYDPAAKTISSFGVPNLSLTPIAGYDQALVDSYGELWFMQSDVNGSNHQVILHDQTGKFTSAGYGYMQLIKTLTYAGSNVFLSGEDGTGKGVFYKFAPCPGGC